MKYFCFPDDKFVLNRGSCTIIACSLDRDKGELAKSMEGFVFSRWSIWLARRKRYDKINSIAEVHYSDKLLVRGMKNLHHQLTLRREKQMNRIGEARHSDMTYGTEILIQGNKLLLGKNKVKQEFTIGSEVIKVDDATIRYPKDAEDGENPNESYWVMDLSTCVVTYDN